MMRWLVFWAFSFAASVQTQLGLGSASLAASDLLHRQLGQWWVPVSNPVQDTSHPIPSLKATDKAEQRTNSDKYSIWSLVLDLKGQLIPPRQYLYKWLLHNIFDTVFNLEKVS